MSLSFSENVELKIAEKIFLQMPDGTKRKPDFGKDPSNNQYGVRFNGVFPEKSQFKIVMPPDMVDMAGRRPENAAKFPLLVKTDSFPPLAKFSGKFGVIESGAGGLLPVTIRRLEKDLKLIGASDKGSVGDLVTGQKTRLSSLSEIIYWKSRAESVDREVSIFDEKQRLEPTGNSKRSMKIPQTQSFTMPGRTTPDAFEVIGIPLKKPGFYVVELASEKLGSALLGKKSLMYVPATALVTNLSVHFKWGYESSLVWVTSLDKGEPVAGASVEVVDCKGTVLATGVADGSGLVQFNALPGERHVASCSSDYAKEFNSGVTVVARKNDDMSFVHSSWDEGIEKWRFKVNYGWSYRPDVISTVFDRTLFRAGDTVNMKHFTRRRTMSGFKQLDAAKNPSEITITHYGSDTTFKLPLKWDGAGIAETTWKIPKGSKLGTWGISFTESDEREYASQTTFRVEEFRVPLLKGSIQPPNVPQVRPKEIPVDVSVSYLSGGGASNLGVKVRKQIRKDSYITFQDFPEMVFSRGEVKPGRQTSENESYNDIPSDSEGNYVEEDGQIADGESSDTSATTASVKKDPNAVGSLTLDSQGTGRYVVKGLEKCESCVVVVEAEYKDPSGEIQTLSRTIQTYGADRLIAVAADSWISQKDLLKFKAVVVDPSGKPVAGAAVDISLFEREQFSHRKRLIGGFYSYDSYSEIKAVGPLCSGKTNSKGVVECEGKPPKSGNLIAQAVTKDGSGNISASTADVWVPGTDEWWWSPTDSDRIDLLAEKKHYEPGEKARFQLRAPFRSGKILVTVEREGVIKGWVQALNSKEPVIEVPIEDTYAPNVFVSAFVVRGRVNDVKPTALVDLGRPAFKMGLAEINVGWKAHKLEVSVKADREVYKVREKSKVKIKVATAKGDALPGMVEVAVAAVDEGLLELKPNETWDLLKEMMGQRSLTVVTSTAQMRVIGKRHFGIKALPSGGGGGEQSTRELFDTLLLWKGRVQVSPTGEAEIEIPLNDSISSFKIVAIASAGADRFGSGSTSIRTSQDIMLLSGLPQLARQGDRLKALYTLRNTTDSARDVTLGLKTTPVLPGLSTQKIKLASGESREVVWDILVPVSTSELIYEVEARVGDQVVDRIKSKQKVIPAVAVRAFQSTIAQVDSKFEIPVETPADAEKGRGEIRVALMPTLASNLDGVRRYMQDYRYSCMEQLVSRAVALRDKALWANAMTQLPAHLDGEGFAMYFPGMRYGSDTLTSYILNISEAAGWVVPESSKTRMIQAMENFVSGKSMIMNYDRIRAADLPFRKLTALLALANNSPNKFKDQYLTSIDIQPDLWPTSAVIDWYLLLRKMKSIKNNAEQQKKAEGIFRTRMTLNGTRMDFSTDRSDRLWWLMVSGDLNSVRLLHALVDAPDFERDIARIILSVLGRQSRGHWDLTNANAWGVLAIEKFSKKFEKVPVAGTSGITLGAQQASVKWPVKKPDEMVKFVPPLKKEVLSVSHTGAGKPWALVQALFAIPLKEPLFAGYKLTKTIEPVEQKKKGEWARGDIARIRVKIESQQEMTWVVVDDPIPTGTAILGGGLGRDSALSTQGEKRSAYIWPAFEERSYEAFRAFYDWTPRGEWALEYTIRLNNPGEFKLPETRVEAMYAPEIFGEIPNSQWKVGN